MAIRKNVHEKLFQVIEEVSITTNIEKSIFNYAIKLAKQKKISPLNWNNIQFKKLYTQKTRSILWNLKNQKNPQFILNIKNGTIYPTSVGSMHHEEIFPELYAPIHAKIEMRLRNTLDFQNLENAVETNFVCGKCKSRKCTYYSLQTRSADEPMTNYFTCLNCKHKWKD